MYEEPPNSRDVETYCFINCIYRQRIWETLSTHVHTASTRTLRRAHAHASDKCVIYVNFIYRIKRQCLISLFRLAMYIGGTLIKNYLLTYYLYRLHYDDVIMGAMASQITSLAIVYSTVYSDANQRKHQSSASLAFVWEFTGDRWIPRTNGQ